MNPVRMSLFHDQLDDRRRLRGGALINVAAKKPDIGEHSDIAMVSGIRALSRRAFSLGGICALTVAVAPQIALANVDSLRALVQRLFGEAGFEESKVKLIVPELAENGMVVPISVEVDSPMTPDDHVWSLYIYAFDNPVPQICSYSFTPASGKAAISTRIRLAKSQDVIAVAEMSNGKVHVAKAPVKIMIGGCG
jgi:sulfur-oxidizing protein SoxY